jgi:pimeloyl-ACP methyl ester carboxylesterase
MFLQKRGLKVLLTILGILAGINIVLLITGAILRQTYFKTRFRQIKPYGKLYAVFDGKMHLTVLGAGKHTIVLLPGLGVGLPSADFGPLMRKLAEQHRVVALEYFGSGFSSGSQRERNNSNYVEEIRAALGAAGLSAPYVLMPHSISNIYSEYYASQYPEEIKAIVSLDGTSSAFWQKESDWWMKLVLPLAKLQEASGFTSILGRLLTNRSKLQAYGFTEREIDDMALFAGFSVNDTLLRQLQSSVSIIEEIKDLPYPAQIPFLKIISQETYQTPNKQVKITPQEYQRQHLAKIGKLARFEILEGSHFIYLNNVERIAELTSNFLDELEDK